MLEFLEQQGAAWPAWDDQDDVVVEAVGPVKADAKYRGYEWSVTLSRPEPLGKALRLRLLARHGQQAYESDPLPGCPAPVTPPAAPAVGATR